ncbi:MAG: hypothetical protein MEP57_05815 [Microvirga sp.]|nr:hypothetical protein [Microvirga sp.]
MTGSGMANGPSRRARAAAGWRALAAGLCAVLVPAVWVAPAHACRWEPSSERVAGYAGEGEIALASGARALVADVAVADDEAAAVIVARAARSDHAVAFLAGADEDRWRRRPARILLDPGSDAPRDLAATLIATGAARVDPGAREALCDAALLAREETARRAGRGLWREERIRPLSADQPELILERAGRFAIVEGVVVGVGERTRRTYIDFSRNWDGGFTVMATPRIWSALVARGLDADALTGRRIRVRGIIQIWRGPAVELTTADFVETMDAERRRR